MIRKIKIPSNRILKIILFFTLFVGVFIAFYAFLYNGIRIQSFGLAGTQIQGFYLRLDKKLILEINSLHINDVKSDDSSFDIPAQIRIAKNIHFILQYFEKINIQNIFIQDYRANLFYDGENFMLNLPAIYAKLNLAEDASKVLIQIHDLYLKPYGIYYSGSGEYDLRNQKVLLNGSLDILNKESYYSYVRLKLNAQSDLKTLHLRGSSNVFGDIQFLRPLLPKIENALVDAWIFDNYSVESAQIDDFSVAIPLGGNNILQKAIESLNILGTARNTEVIFHPNLPPAHAESVKLVFANNALEFHPQSPTYQKHLAKGTMVALRNLVSNKPSLELSLNTNAPLDSSIMQVLKAYDITLPITAPKAKITTNLFLSLDLMTHAINVKGLFKAKDSEVLLNGIPFFTKTLNVQLDNHIIKVESQNLNYSNLLQSDSNFVINTAEHSISGDMLIHSLVLADADILQVSNHSLPFNIDFSNHDSINLTLPTLQFTANLADSYTFKISNLNHFLPFSKVLRDYEVTNGTMQLETSDFTHYNGIFHIASNQNLLLDKATLAPISSMDLSLQYTPKGFSLESQGSLLKLEKDSNAQSITLKDIALNLDKIKSIEGVDTIPTRIKGINSNIIFKELNFLSDSFEFHLNGDTITGNLKYKNGIADLYKRGSGITIDAREFGDDFVNTLAKKHAFSRGRFFLNANTNEKGVLVGEMKLLNTSLDELNVLQNLMAFIDTIPSLLSFKQPGFNQQGYYLENGTIHFGLNDTFLAIDKLDFKGSSIDIKGQGILQLESKIIDFNAELITAKSLSGIINKIPLVNYILLGKDGTISTAFKIKGTLNNLEIQTQTTQDVMLAPFNILMRTLTSPFEIFN